MSFFCVFDVDGEWTIDQSIIYAQINLHRSQFHFFLRELRGSVSLIIGPKPLFQSEAFDMKLKLYFHANKTHFYRTSMYQTSFWKWEFLEIGNGLLHKLTLESYLTRTLKNLMRDKKIGICWKRRRVNGRSKGGVGGPGPLLFIGQNQPKLRTIIF